jgi:hypothetical protein
MSFSATADRLQATLIRRIRLKAAPLKKLFEGSSFERKSEYEYTDILLHSH